MKANYKRVLRLMKADGRLVPKNLRFRATRRNSSTEKAKPKTIEPNRFWGTDRTKTMLPQSGWAYLHIVIDWGDKKLLAAHLSRTSRSQDWITALEQAVASEFPMGIRALPAGYDVPELVSDHGSQPASTAFRGACEALTRREKKGEQEWISAFPEGKNARKKPSLATTRSPRENPRKFPSCREKERKRSEV